MTRPPLKQAGFAYSQASDRASRYPIDFCSTKSWTPTAALIGNLRNTHSLWEIVADHNKNNHPRARVEGPEGPVIEPVCLNWDTGCDVLQFALDKSGRYIYYFPVSYDKEVSPPLVQFDVKTGKKKVLCWLEEYYFEKYGYWVGGTYGIELTEDDSTLIICMNGSFQGRDKHFGKPSLFVVGIPEEERRVE